MDRWGIIKHTDTHDTLYSVRQIPAVWSFSRCFYPERFAANRSFLTVLFIRGETQVSLVTLITGLLLLCTNPNTHQ